MASKVIVKNSVVAGRKPATAATNKPGELWVNVADKVLGTFDAAGAPVELSSPCAIPFFSPLVDYKKNDAVWYNGALYVAPADIPKGPWDATKWGKPHTTPPPTPAGTNLFSANIYDGNGTEQTINSGVDLLGHGGLIISKARDHAYDFEFRDTVRGLQSGMPLNNQSNDWVDDADAVTALANGHKIKLPKPVVSYSHLNETGVKFVDYTFRIEPGFFDIVKRTCTGGSAVKGPHSLGVTPEFILSMMVGLGPERALYTAAEGHDQYYYFAETGSKQFENEANVWGPAPPTATEFYMNESTFSFNVGVDYVVYLFASKPGVCKVGRYTGDGSPSQKIDCGFTAGARFVMLQCSTIGGWHIYDTARGITPTGGVGLNTSDKAGMDLTVSGEGIAPDPSGFKVLQGSTYEFNKTGVYHNYLAIA